MKKQSRYFTHSSIQGKQAPAMDAPDYINAGCDDELEVYGYDKSLFKFSLTWIVTVFTLGLFRLVLYWFPAWYVFTSYSRCTLDKATCLLMRDGYKDWSYRFIHSKVGYLFYFLSWFWFVK